jgi:hypothetical protein
VNKFEQTTFRKASAGRAGRGRHGRDLPRHDRACSRSGPKFAEELLDGSSVLSCALWRKTTGTDADLLWRFGPARRSMLARNHLRHHDGRENTDTHGPGPAGSVTAGPDHHRRGSTLARWGFRSLHEAIDTTTTARVPHLRRPADFIRELKAPYDLAEHFERHGDYFTDGPILESTRIMGAGKHARERRIVYQYSFKRRKHVDRAIRCDRLGFPAGRQVVPDHPVSDREGPKS